MRDGVKNGDSIATILSNGDSKVMYQKRYCYTDYLAMISGNVHINDLQIHAASLLTFLENLEVK